VNWRPQMGPPPLKLFNQKLEEKKQIGFWNISSRLTSTASFIEISWPPFPTSGTLSQTMTLESYLFQRKQSHEIWWHYGYIPGRKWNSPWKTLPIMDEIQLWHFYMGTKLETMLICKCSMYYGLCIPHNIITFSRFKCVVQKRGIPLANWHRTLVNLLVGKLRFLLGWELSIFGFIGFKRMNRTCDFWAAILWMYFKRIQQWGLIMVPRVPILLFFEAWCSRKKCHPAFPSLSM